MSPRCDHHPDAAADRDITIIRSERGAERARDAFRQLEHGLWRVHVLDEDGELIATQYGDRVLGSQGRLEALADRDEQPVAHRVAEAVVHCLEPVEIQEQ